jgi:crotonobetainyl-CoA:carnitine CoA-transferase CaiB-like acyl-CoA transferase
VRTLDEVYSWEQTRQQGLIVQVDHPGLGAIDLPGPPWSYDEGARTRHAAPPTLGQHDASVRAWLDEADLRDAVTGAAPPGATRAPVAAARP